MIEQGSLFDMAPRRPHAPYARNSETSKAAADRIAPRSHLQREQVYEAILACGERGATRKELEDITGLGAPSLCPRLLELEGIPSKRLESRIRKLYELRGGESVQIKRSGCSVYVAGRVAVRGAA